MKVKRREDKLKGNRHHNVRGNPTKYVNCQDCTAEERQKSRRAEKWLDK